MFKTIEELHAELREVENRRAALFAEHAQIQTRAEGLDASDAGLNERLGRLNAGIEKLDGRKAAIEDEIGRHERLRDAADDISQGEPGGQHFARRASSPRTGVDRVRDEALRAIEQNAGHLSARSGDVMESLVRSDTRGLASEYVAAIAPPEYIEAFGKYLRHGPNAHLHMTPDELRAFQRVAAADEARALSVGTTTAGGFAVPFTLDPTILLSGAGSTNPVRRIARVESVITDTWKGVSSAGITAGYSAEATEVGDGSPALAQPTVSTEKGQAFVPFSIEVGMDWSSLQSEMARLLQDARDQADATSMLTGDGSDDLGGILNIGGTGGLTTTQRVLTSGTAQYAIADVYALKQAVPARFLPSSTWALNPNTIDTTRDFVPAGSTSRAPIFSADESLLLRRPYVEWSTMSSAATTGNKLAILGDWNNYLVADRIGTTIELVPHLFGASGRPTGQRGFFMYWRTGAGVLVPNAFRYLEAK